MRGGHHPQFIIVSAAAAQSHKPPFCLACAWPPPFCARTFVAYQQALSSRSDLVPKTLANALSKLQDSMQVTLDSSVAASIIRKELQQKNMENEVIERF